MLAISPAFLVVVCVRRKFRGHGRENSDPIDELWLEVRVEFHFLFPGQCFLLLIVVDVDAFATVSFLLWLGMAGIREKRLRKGASSVRCNSIMLSHISRQEA